MEKHFVSFMLNSVQKGMLLDLQNVSLFQFVSLDNSQAHTNYISATHFYADSNFKDISKTISLLSTLYNDLY